MPARFVLFSLSPSLLETKEESRRRKKKRENRMKRKKDHATHCSLFYLLRFSLFLFLLLSFLCALSRSSFRIYLHLHSWLLVLLTVVRCVSYSQAQFWLIASRKQSIGPLCAIGLHITCAPWWPESVEGRKREKEKDLISRKDGQMRVARDAPECRRW